MKSSALTNHAPLAYPLFLKDGTKLETIADAASFIVKLPQSHDAMLWRVAGTSLENAGHTPDDNDALVVATNAVEEALIAAGFLPNI